MESLEVGPGVFLHSFLRSVEFGVRSELVDGSIMWKASYHARGLVKKNLQLSPLSFGEPEVWRSIADAGDKQSFYHAASNLFVRPTMSTANPLDYV